MGPRAGVHGFAEEKSLLSLPGYKPRTVQSVAQSKRYSSAHSSHRRLMERSGSRPVRFTRAERGPVVGY